MAFLAEVLEGVLGETLELVADGPLGRLHLFLERLKGLRHALGHDVLAPTDLGSVDAEDLALAHPFHDLRPDVVDQRDPGRRDQQRTDVRVAPGDRPGGVDHRARLGLDELLGRYAIEVFVVDDGDVAGLQPSRQALGADVDTRRANDPGVGAAVPALGHVSTPAGETRWPAVPRRDREPRRCPAGPTASARARSPARSRARHAPTRWCARPFLPWSRRPVRGQRRPPAASG